MAIDQSDFDDSSEEVEVDDESADDPVDVLPDYTMLSYGADFDLTGLIGRLQSDEIQIPQFQREFIWTARQASRFIESILIGLPVPGIFLWRHPTSGRFTVVDGQQRLRTVQYFKEGLLRGREFVLPERTSPYQKMAPRFQRRSYRQLEDEDRRRFDNTILHATIVQQERPEADDSSIFYLFERINAEGTPLAAEEIRTAVYQGDLIALLSDLNELPDWRSLYGPKSPRMKDRELIARFFALYEDYESYARPMKEFLNRFYRANRILNLERRDLLRARFTSTVSVIMTNVGVPAFRPVKALNAAVFDAVTIGVAKRLERGEIEDGSSLKSAYDSLLADTAFQALFSRGGTSDAENVRSRIAMAVTRFASIP
jgi:hypothetical protein